jgi:hypothetical protein
MERDAELGDTVLHVGGYIIRDAVEGGLKKAERLPRSRLPKPGSLIVV